MTKLKHNVTQAENETYQVVHYRHTTNRKWNDFMKYKADIAWNQSSEQQQLKYHNKQSKNKISIPK